MIDFVKVNAVLFTGVDITANPLLDFEKIVNTKTGELKQFSTAKHKNLKFTLYDSGRLLITGSLHKYFNFQQRVCAPNQFTFQEKEKGFNGNDFNYTQLVYCLNSIEQNFGVSLDNSRLENIEFGVNLNHEFITDKLLNGLLRHYGKEFYRPHPTSFRKLDHEQYKFKIYNKGSQYGMPKEVLRYELQYNRMEQLNKVGLNYLSDLKSVLMLNNLLEVLVIKWNEILFFDYTIREHELKPKEKLKVLNFKNVDFWQGIRPNRMSRIKEQLNTITLNHSQNIKPKVCVLIADKWKELNTNCRTRLNMINNMECVKIDSSSISSKSLHIIDKHFVSLSSCA